MALAKQIAYNVVFNSIAKIIATVLALVAIGLITRSLGTDGFGDYSVMLAFFAFFNAVGDLGLATVMAREISRENADEKTIAGSVFALRLAVSTVVFLLMPLIVFFLPYAEPVKWAIVLAAAAFGFSSASMTLNGIFQKNLAMYRVSLIELGGKLIQVGIIAIGWHYNLGFLFISSSLLAYMAFNFFLVFHAARKFIPFSLHFDKVFWKQFLHEALPVGASAFIGFAYFKTDTILLSLFQSSSDVGIYNAAYKVIENITFFPAMVVGLVLPLLSRFIFTDRSKFEMIANKTFKFFLVLIVPILIGGSFLAPEIIQLIGGAQFTGSVPVLQIIIFSLAGIFMGSFFNTILLVGNQQIRLMKALALVAVINISLNLFLIPRYSYFGSAWVSLVTEGLVALFGMYLTYKHLGYFPSFVRFGRILLSGAPLAVFLWYGSSLHFVILILGGIAVYLLALFITRTVEKDELASLFLPAAQTEPESQPSIAYLEAEEELSASKDERGF